MFLVRYSLTLFAIIDLSVTELLFIFNSFRRLDLSFPFSTATFSIDQDFFIYFLYYFQVVYWNIVFSLTV